MENSIKITAMILGTVVVLALLGVYAFSQMSPSMSNTVSANGQATVKTTPDVVSVYFNVEAKGANATEAKDKNAEIVDELITALVKKGFERKQIETQNFNVYPNTQWINGQSVTSGFIATHSIRVELSTDDSDKIGDVIDAGVDAGAQISYINFELSQALQNQYKAQALNLATQDARTKAEAIASGLGKKLGRIVSTSTSDFNYSPWRLYDSAATASNGMEAAATAKLAATSIQPGQQEVYGSVSVVYKLA